MNSNSNSNPQGTMQDDSTEYYLLTVEDIGKPAINAFGRSWLVQNFMGRIFECDVGKRVYLRGGVLQVESDEQRNRREGRHEGREVGGPSSLDYRVFTVGSLANGPYCETCANNRSDYPVPGMIRSIIKERDEPPVCVDCGTVFKPEPVCIRVSSKGEAGVTTRVYLYGEPQDPVFAAGTEEAAIEAAEQYLEWCILIDGELIDTDTEVHHFTIVPMIVNNDGGDEWYVAEDSEAAGQKAREYWEEMAENEPREFTCMVGEETLIQWGLGRSAGPGSAQVNSLQEWLDLWLNAPEDHFASYDGTERDVEWCGESLSEELGFIPTVAYRHN